MKYIVLLLLVVVHTTYTMEENTKDDTTKAKEKEEKEAMDRSMREKLYNDRAFFIFTSDGRYADEFERYAHESERNENNKE